MGKLKEWCVWYLLEVIDERVEEISEDDDLVREWVDNEAEAMSEFMLSSVSNYVNQTLPEPPLKVND